MPCITRPKKQSQFGAKYSCVAVVLGRHELTCIISLRPGNPTFRLGSSEENIFFAQTNPNQCDRSTTYKIIEPKTKPNFAMTKPEDDAYKPIPVSAWRLVCRFDALSIQNANGPRPGTASDQTHISGRQTSSLVCG